MVKVIRAAIGTGIMFSLVLAVAFTITGILQWSLVGGDLRERMIDTIVRGAAPVGFMMGVVFSIVISITQRQRRFVELSILRVGVLGAVVGLVVFVVLWGGSYSSLWDDLFNAALFAVLGWGGAAGTLVLVRVADAVWKARTEPRR